MRVIARRDEVPEYARADAPGDVATRQGTEPLQRQPGDWRRQHDRAEPACRKGPTTPRIGPLMS